MKDTEAIDKIREICSGLTVEQRIMVLQFLSSEAHFEQEKERQLNRPY